MRLTGFVMDDDGVVRCPTERCGALCCRLGNPFDKDPAERYNTEYYCSFLQIGDPIVFRISRNSFGVDSVNTPLGKDTRQDDLRKTGMGALGVGTEIRNSDYPEDP